MSGTIRSGSISSCEPSPVQRGQAPCGELKEKIRGCSSGSETPCSGQANFSREEHRLSVDDVDRDEPVGERRRGLDRLGQPLAQVGLQHEPVDDHLDLVLELLVEDDLLLEQPHLPVDLDAGEAVRAQLLEHVAELALAVAHDRGVDRELRPLRQRQDLLDDLVEALPGDRAAADRAVRAADARVEQAQVVVDLGHRPDRRARVARGRLLVDRDRRREPVDRVDVGLLHHLQELARVRGEALDVAALALGVDRVERERGLARSGQPGDTDEGVPRQPDVDVLEVVLAGPVDDQLVGGHVGDHSSERTYVRPGGPLVASASVSPRPEPVPPTSPSQPRSRRRPPRSSSSATSETARSRSSSPGSPCTCSTGSSAARSGRS